MTIAELRSHKIFGLAIFDLTMSFIGIIALFMIARQYHFKKLNWWKFLVAAIIVTIPLSITFHVLFGVNTQLNFLLGLSNKPLASVQ